MDDTCTVGLVEGVRDLNGERQSLIQRQRAFCQALRQCLPFEILEDEKVSALVTTDVVQGANVWMAQRSDRPCLTLEPFAQCRVPANV